MNEDPSGDRGRQRRSPSWRATAIAAAAAGLAVLTAACGGSSSPTAPMGMRQQLQQALAYSQCMRSHGITNFPDPTENNGSVNSNGATYVGVGITIPDGIDTNSPTYLSATNADFRGW